MLVPGIFFFYYRAESILGQHLFSFLRCGFETGTASSVAFFFVFCFFLSGIVYLPIYPLPPTSSSSAVILNHTFHLQLYMHAVCQQRFAPVSTITHHHQRFLFGRTFCNLPGTKKIRESNAKVIGCRAIIGPLGGKQSYQQNPSGPSQLNTIFPRSHLKNWAL